MKAAADKTSGICAPQRRSYRHATIVGAASVADDTKPRAKPSPRQQGQTFTECLIVVVSVALIAMLGFSAMSSGIGAQSASMAEALAGGANS